MPDTSRLRALPILDAVGAPVAGVARKHFVDGLASVIDEHMDARRPGLRDRLPGGTRTILGPHGPEPDFMVGPVRVVGMSGGDGKLLVLGWEMRGEGGFGEEHRWFNPSSAWWGSANWTKTVAGKLPKRR